MEAEAPGALALSEEFAYVIPIEKFVYREGSRWKVETPITQNGLTELLHSLGWEKEFIAATLKSHHYYKARGWDMFPGGPPIFKVADDKNDVVYLNTWQPPTVQPTPGPFPNIERVIDWLTGHDQLGATWLKHWIAQKVQDQELLPKVAVLFGTTPGAGKGTLAFAIRQILGMANTTTIQRGNLETKFNKRWVGKLFVLADEVVTNDKLRNISEQLKVLIDGAEVELQGKGENQLNMRNRLAWMFASNDKLTPVSVEAEDRRYTVFNNHDPLPPDYVKMLNDQFHYDRVTPTAEFMREIAGFYDYLLKLEVDHAFVTRPYFNEDRASLIRASMSSHDTFFEYVEDGGLPELVDQILTQEWSLNKGRDTWDWGERGISTQALYRCYVEFCKRNGAHPVRSNKFGIAIRAHRPVWTPVRPYIAKLDRQVYGYVVPRKQTKKLEEKNPAEEFKETQTPPPGGVKA